MKLYVIRHGQTNWNKEGKIQGLTDIPLNEEGIKQAEKAKQIVDNIHIDKVICSTLNRTKETAKIVTQNKNLPIECDERIIERNFGEFEGKSIKEIDLTPYSNWKKNLQVKEGESFQEVCKRVFEFLDEIQEKYKNKNVLIVTHGGVARAVGCYYYGIPEDGDTKIYMSDNCEIKEYEKR